MTGDDEIRLFSIKTWDKNQIVELYRQGGWWKEEWDPASLDMLIEGSFRFMVAVDMGMGHAIGMGRVISDGVSDGYIQDLVVHSRYRGRGIGSRLLNALVAECLSAGLKWIGCIAEPGTDEFYYPAGFTRLERYIPLIFTGDVDNSHP